MSQNKNAQIRFRIIDKAIRNPYNPYPGKTASREEYEAIRCSVYGNTICGPV